MLASHLYAGTCRWLEVVGEIDRRGEWAESGRASCAEWLAWRCALTPRSAREHVRVARRLPELPLIHAAFALAPEDGTLLLRALDAMRDARWQEARRGSAEPPPARQATTTVGATRSRLCRAWHVAIPTSSSPATTSWRSKRRPASLVRVRLSTWQPPWTRCSRSLRSSGRRNVRKYSLRSLGTRSERE